MQGCFNDNTSRLVPNNIIAPNTGLPYQWTSEWDCLQAAAALGYDTAALQVRDGVAPATARHHVNYTNARAVCRRVLRGREFTIRCAGARYGVLFWRVAAWRVVHEPGLPTRATGVHPAMHGS